MHGVNDATRTGWQIRYQTQMWNIYKYLILWQEAPYEKDELERIIHGYPMDQSVGQGRRIECRTRAHNQSEHAYHASTLSKTDSVVTNNANTTQYVNLTTVQHKK